MIRASLALALLCAGTLAQAQVLRALPADARRGQIRHVQEMIVQIDGKLARLSAGAQLRDAYNRVLVPMAIPPNSVVKYVVNGQGEVSAVWILTEHEAAQ